MSPGWRFGRRPEPPGDDWRQARPAAIQRALSHALALPDCGWRVLDASRRIGRKPRAFVVQGDHLIVWRTDGDVLAAPEACPHMGASLAGARVCDGHVLCPWHALALGREGHGSWRCRPVYDDGVLVWVRTATADHEEPAVPPRPAQFIDGVIRVEAACEPADVIANRLDPWHGVHFHPYSFAALEVIEESPELLRVVVEKRVLGPLRVAVEATFHCPSPFAIVMTITGGEGEGSVVETHATPLAPGRTAVVEATLATSPRQGFRFGRALAWWIRPFIERSARRLWVDDAAYAERLAELRRRATAARPNAEPPVPLDPAEMGLGPEDESLA